MNHALCLLLAVLGGLTLALTRIDPSKPPAERGSFQTDPRPPVTIRAIAYNVQFLPGFAAWANRRPHTAYRAREIGRQLASFDIVALNEVFDDLSRRRLLEALRANAPGSVHEIVSDEPSDHRFCAGLAIITRFPIVATHQFAYSTGSEVRSKGILADGFAAKGVLHARLELTAPVAPGHETAHPPRHVDVFVTHLESRDPAIRAVQCQELGRFVARHRAPGADAVVLGDFNIRGPHDGQLPASSEYDSMLAALNGHGDHSAFQDLWPVHGHGPGGTNDQSSPGAGHRIDYILHAVGAAPMTVRSIRVNPYADPRTEALSDHSAVEAVFELP
jgi:endonuclease/exonuclease/phosphatase family metal-dependent hydrolase